MLPDFAIDLFEGERLHREFQAVRQQRPMSPARFASQPAMLITGHQALAEAFRDYEQLPGLRLLDVDALAPRGQWCVAPHAYP